MTIVDIDGKHHFFVVTMTTSGAQLVKLRYDGSTYDKVGAYSVRLKDAAKAVSGINRVSVTSTKINFTFKSGRQIYNASIPLWANSGTVNLTQAFDLKVAGALVDGKAISGPEGWNNQGFFYDTAKKVLYYPLTTSGRSVVLVYRNVAPSTKGNVASARNLSFRITSHVYPTKFEIEGIGISGGQLYFTTNGSNKNGANDGVHVFKKYVS